VSEDAGAVGDVVGDADRDVVYGIHLFDLITDAA